MASAEEGSDATSIIVKNVYEGGKSYVFEGLPLTMLVSDFKARLCDHLDEVQIPPEATLGFRN